MMDVKRVIAILLCLMLITAVFSGCGANDGTGAGGDVTESTAIADESIFSATDFNIVDANGEAAYRIVRSEEDSDVAPLAARIIKAVKETCGVALKNIPDTSEDSGAEIIIGKCERESSKKVAEYFDAANSYVDEFIIATVDDDLVIYGGSNAALEKAVEYFTENYVKTETIAGGIRYEKKTENTYTEFNVNGVGIKNFVVVRPHYNSSYLTQLQLENLVSEIEQRCGYGLKIVEDTYTEPAAHEIIVGNAKRDGVKTFDNYDDYEIAVKGGNIYLNGGHAYSTAMAVSEFAKLIPGGSITDSASVSGSYKVAIGSYDKSKYYTATFFDDFNGSTLDETKWRVVSGTERSSTGKNGGKSYRSKEPDVFGFNDGVMYMNAKYDGKDYYGAMICTDKTMLYRYGYLEVSQLLPQGPGFWIATWLSGQTDFTSGNFRSEIDVNEMFGNSAVVAANCHRWPTNEGKALGFEHNSLDGKTYGTLKKCYAKEENFNNGFHTFGFEWLEDRMSFTCDGEIYFTYTMGEDPNDTDAFSEWQLIRISLATGFDTCGLDINNATADEWQYSNSFKTDYCYVYQLEDGKQEIKSLLK